jgi:hypothetical protein
MRMRPYDNDLTGSTPAPCVSSVPNPHQPNLAAPTDADKVDLKRLYRAAWMGQLTELNETPIKFVKPFNTIGDPAENVVAVWQIQTVLQSPRRRRRS